MSKLSELPKKYPRLFNDKPFYFECNDGWYDLIDTLLLHIERNLKPEQVVYISQIKEKFGTLRFYCHDVDEETYAMIDFAQMMSGKICEVCGNRGQVRDDVGWYYTSCEEHKRGCEEYKRD